MLRGFVIDAESSTPLPNVVVTNGRECVKTAKDGAFELPEPVEPVARNGGASDAFIYISTPAGYRPETPGGWFHNLTRQPATNIAFRLVQDKSCARDAFTFAHLTDLHVGKYPAHWIADDILSICTTHPELDCIVATGDVTQAGRPEEYDAYLDACGASSLPLIHVPGNHDWSADKCGAMWTRRIGPLYFSLDWGPVHLIAYDSTHSRYTDELPIDDWLAADLALVPPERPVVFLLHHQFTSDFYDRVRAMTSPPRRIVMSISGHWHTSRLFDDGSTLHFNQPTTSMGGIDYSPRGYATVRIDLNGDAELKRHLLGTSQRGRLTGIGSVVEPPPEPIDPEAAPARTTAAWPQFGGGTRRTGYAPGGPAPPFRRLWQTRLPGGLLFGSPVLDADAAYIPVLDEQNPTGGMIVCTDLRTGAIRWQAPTGGSVKHSVALHEGLAIGVNVTGQVMALDVQTGEKRWTRQLGDPSERWIFNAPLVDSGRVYTGHSQCFVCLDAESGEQVWSRDLGRSDWISSYPCPVADETTLYVGFFWHPEVAWALDRETGDTRWVIDEPHSARGPAATPVLNPDGTTLYVLCHDAILRACDTSDGRILWQYDLEQDGDVRAGPRWSPASPALDGNEILYIATGDGAVFALDTQSRERLWTWQADPSLASVEAYGRDLSSVMSSPVASGKALIFGASDGRIVALDRHSGDQVWIDAIGAPVISSPAVSGNLLVCGASDGWLYAWTAV